MTPDKPACAILWLLAHLRNEHSRLCLVQMLGAGGPATDAALSELEQQGAVTCSGKNFSLTQEGRELLARQPSPPPTERKALLTAVERDIPDEAAVDEARLLSAVMAGYDLDLPEAIRYAKARGIGVILYVNQIALRQQLDELLPLYRQWGVSGIKFGFVDVGPQRHTRWLHEAVRKCAEYGLVVNIHDEYRPTGFSRTYPNLLTQEGIRGNEEFEDATHNVTQAFIRFIAGAADNTVCYYRRDFNRNEAMRDHDGKPMTQKLLKTTPAHQLALPVVYYSPLQYLYWYDKPSDSENEPELAFYDHLPTVWDDTRVLDGEIGRFIVTARRSGHEWFVGALGGNAPEKPEISFSFLPRGKRYRAIRYTDGGPETGTRTRVAIDTLTVTRRTLLQQPLEGSGGAAFRLIPER